MALNKEVKAGLVKKYARNPKDTGSAEIQIAILTEEINAFKTRFSKLIENFFENSYAERDINDMIELIGLMEENNYGN
jgi:ribosomal protein S15